MANFHELFVTKIVKILDTRSQILRLECTKFDFGWGFTADPIGELTALSRPLAGCRPKGLLLRGGRGWRERVRRGREGRKR